MANLPVGILILVGVAVLIFLGLAERVLDRMRLTDRQALIVLVLIYLGYLLPPLAVGRNLEVNIGGALLPLALVIYLLYRADTDVERVRAVTSAVVVAALLYAFERVLPVEPGTLAVDVDPVLMPGLLAGITGYILGGRSRRTAFIAAVLGVILLDIANVFWLQRHGLAEQTITLGGAGIFDVILISGVLAVLLAELVGEVRERLSNG